ncbi:MAG TPA: hypothetical protein VIV88_18655 [Gemmatimonadales bacterium]|jgi:hypothetical protein
MCRTMRDDPIPGEGANEHIRNALAILHTPLLTVDRENAAIVSAAIARLWKALDQLEQRRQV